MNTRLLQLAATQLGTVYVGFCKIYSASNVEAAKKPEEEDRAPQEKKPRETVVVSSGEEGGVGLARTLATYRLLIVHIWHQGRHPSAFSPIADQSSIIHEISRGIANRILL